MNDDLIIPEWFNLQEFDDFITSERLEEAVSVATRLKLARAAKRTAKRRAFLTKARANKRRGMTQLKKRAVVTVKRMMKKRLFKGDWNKLSYAQRKRFDDSLSKRKKFMNAIVKQIMPKVIKGEATRLASVQKRKIEESFITEQEKTLGDERIAARKRKQVQREKEKQIRQTNPAQMAMVVRDKNNRLIIVDKDSYEPQNHIPVVKPQDMSYSMALRVSQDPAFKTTLTAERILGDSGSSQEKAAPTEKPSGEQPPQQIVQQQQDLGVPSGTPLPDNTEIDASSAKWLPGIALNLMKGISVDQMVKQKMITPEQAEQYMFSQNMQNFAMQIAQKLAEAFFKLTGRNINEYQMQFIGSEPMPMSDLWNQNQSNINNPKSDIIFTHGCVSESTKDKKCQQNMCACDAYGVSPDEQIIKINVKFGTVSFMNGRANGDVRAIVSYMMNKINNLISGAERFVIDPNNNLCDSDKRGINQIIVQLDGFNTFLENSFKNYNLLNGMSTVGPRSSEKAKLQIDNHLQKMNEFKMEVNRRLREIFSTNRIAQKIFLHEILTGQQKYENSLASASHLLTIDPKTVDIKLNKIDEALIDQIIDTEQFTMDINFKPRTCGSEIEEAVFNESSEKYMNTNSEPIEIDPNKFCGRAELTVKKLKENRFKYSMLGILFEQTPMEPQNDETPVDKADEFELIYLSNFFKKFEELSKNLKKPIQKYSALMTIFNSEPYGIFTTPVDLFTLIEDRDGIKVTPITINGKERFINIMNVKIFDSDNPKTLEDMNEHYMLARAFLEERKKRNYRREYDTFHAKEEQKDNRAKRNKNRRRALKKGRVKKGDKKDIDHVNGNPKDNSADNLRVVSQSYNRSKK